MNQKKKKAFALTQQDREQIPNYTERTNVTQIDSITGGKVTSYGIENCGAAVGEEYYILAFIDKKTSALTEVMEKLSWAVSDLRY